MNKNSASEGAKIETDFFDIVATHNDRPSCVKHVFIIIYVFFTVFRYRLLGEEGGGVSKGLVTQPALAVLQPVQFESQSCGNWFF